MATKKVENTDIVLQLALLTEQVRLSNESLTGIAKDHENRLRTTEEAINALRLLIEKIDGRINSEVTTIRERMTVLGMLQGAFSTIAASLAFLIRMNNEFLEFSRILLYFAAASGLIYIAVINKAVAFSLCAIATQFIIRGLLLFFQLENAERYREVSNLVSTPSVVIMTFFIFLNLWNIRKE